LVYEVKHTWGSRRVVSLDPMEFSGCKIMKIYVKLRNGEWMLITRKIEQTTITKNRRTTRYILAGETASSVPSLGKSDSLRVPGGIVNKVISKLLDVNGEDAIIIEPLNKEYYVIKVPRNNREVVEKILSELASRRNRKTTEIPE